MMMRGALLSVWGVCMLGFVGCTEDAPAASSAVPSAKNDASVSDGATYENTEAGTEAATADSAPTSSNTDGAPSAEPSGVVQVLGLNDWHATLEPIVEKDSKTQIQTFYAGLAILSSYFKRDRAENPNTIMLSAGDDIGPGSTLSAYGTDIPDEPAIRGWNLLGLTAGCLGNHNFDRGIAPLKQLVDIAAFSYVGTNLANVQQELGPKVITSYKMVEFGATEPKLRVAVIGITGTETTAIVWPGALGLGSITVREPIAATNAAASDARKAGAHAVVVAAHIGATGFSTDGSNTPVGPLMEYAKALSGVDLVIGGHTETIVQTKVGDLQLVQSLGDGRKYSKTRITIDKGKVASFDVQMVETKGYQIAPALNDAGLCSAASCPTDFICNSIGKCEKIIVAPDPIVDPWLQPYRDAKTIKFDQKLGTITATFPRDGTTEKKGEAPIVEVIADALLYKYKPKGVQIAFHNSGGARTPLPSEKYKPNVVGAVRSNCSVAAPCDLFLGDIYDVLPFGNRAVIREVTGETIWKMLEWGVQTFPCLTDGRFPQVAGMRWAFKLSAGEGVRVQRVVLDDGTEIARNVAAPQSAFLT